VGNFDLHKIGMNKQRGKPFKKGEGGRPPGAVNKVTRTVKEVFAKVFDELQDDPEANLMAWAKANKTEFYKLSSKLLPIQIAGDPEHPVTINAIDGLSFEKLYQLKYGKKPD
jgi:hypothetical protein